MVKIHVVSKMFGKTIVYEKSLYFNLYTPFKHDYIKTTSIKIDEWMKKLIFVVFQNTIHKLTS